MIGHSPLPSAFHRYLSPSMIWRKRVCVYVCVCVCVCVLDQQLGGWGVFPGVAVVFGKAACTAGVP
jgi:hypothetical protein